MSNSVDPSASFMMAIIATIATFFVGAVTKVVSKYFDKDKDRLDMHISLRKELREELDVVKEELADIQKELDIWKQKYYDQVALTNELRAAINNLEQELISYKSREYEDGE